MTDSIFRSVREDARFYRRLHYGCDSGGGLLVLAVLQSPGFWLLAFQRLARYSTVRRNRRNPLWWVIRLLEGIGVLLSAILCRSEFMADCEIRGPLYLSGKGYYMFGALAVGTDCIIHHNVTFGMTVANGVAHRPIVGDRVWIGANCVIAGKVQIGDGATILPNTFLTFSVPPKCVVRGNPARIVIREFDNSSLLSSLEMFSQLPITRD